MLRAHCRAGGAQRAPAGRAPPVVWEAATGACRRAGAGAATATSGRPRRPRVKGGCSTVRNPPFCWGVTVGVCAGVPPPPLSTAAMSPLPRIHGGRQPTFMARDSDGAALCSLNGVEPQWLFWVLWTPHFFARPPLSRRISPPWKIVPFNLEESFHWPASHLHLLFHWPVHCCQRVPVSEISLT